ncbi:MAG: protein-L-isoaspartate(D-aspartate) O-methyltransferase [Bacteroidales bacterium]|nr:protein-L-isoaspartate(D-aspartate) O-methyltransferase [Bacteroidales bacterium]
MILSRFEGDHFQHQGQRRKLINGLIKKGIRDERVLEAMSVVPRHLFMESGFIRFAYQDQAFPIAAGQTISQPYTVAFQTELLELSEHQKVLELGTGSGYQTAVLVEMGMRVFTVERIRLLSNSAETLLKKLDYQAYFMFGDGYKGLPTYGPFDRILITAGAPGIPEDLKNQLTIGGILVAPIGEKDHQTMIKCQRISEDEFVFSEHGGFVFVPLLKGKSDS